jgi:hypothetical protein
MSPSKIGITFPEWVHQTVQTALKVSLTPGSGKDVIYLENLAKELNSETGLAEFSRGNVDRVFMEILMLNVLPSGVSVIRYPADCHFRIQQEKKKTANKVRTCLAIQTHPLLTTPIMQGDSQRLSFLDDLGQLVTNYSALALSSPEVFPQLAEYVGSFLTNVFCF